MVANRERKATVLPGIPTTTPFHFLSGALAWPKGQTFISSMPRALIQVRADHLMRLQASLYAMEMAATYVLSCWDCQAFPVHISTINKTSTCANSSTVMFAVVI